MKKNPWIILTVFVFLLFFSCKKNENPVVPAESTIINGPAVNVAAPTSTVKIMFIHHSTGSAWISSGGLGAALNNNNYYTTESDYYWEERPSPAYPTPIGSYTDTVHWPYWFTDDVMPYCYANTAHYDYTNVISDPCGENEIIMFKSCYPNSEVGDSIADEQGIYNGLLNYFSLHTDKMFILVIPPPEIVISSAALTRQLANWLVNRETGWLANYQHNNVYAFDYYNVLTHPDNHHWVKNSHEQHVIANSSNELYYPGAPGNDHPSTAGHQKATAEFLPLLNGWYHLWKGN